MAENKEVNTISRLSILNRKTIKTDFLDNKNKKDNNIFNLTDRMIHKNIDKKQVEKNVEARIRDTSPYFLGQKNKSFFPPHLKSQIDIGKERTQGKSSSLSVHFQRNRDKPQNIKLNLNKNVNKPDNTIYKSRNNLLITNEEKGELDNELNLINHSFVHFNKVFDDRITAREKKTNIVSKSFIDIRENIKEKLRETNEQEKFFLFNEKQDFIAEKAKRRFSQTERVQQKLKTLITKPKPKVDDYYNKYVYNYKQIEKEQTSIEKIKDRKSNYRQELKSQMDYKRKVKEELKSKDISISADHFIKTVHQQEVESTLFEEKRKAMKREFIHKNNAILHDKKLRKEEEYNRHIQEGNERIRKDNEDRIKEKVLLHNTKNKYQRYILNSLNRQVEEKHKRKNKINQSVVVTSRINNILNDCITEVQ